MRTIEEIAADMEAAIASQDTERMSELYREKSVFYMRDIPLFRLEAICNAERDGRCVVLPCKVGDTVRATVNRPHNGHEATIYGTVTDVQAVVRVAHSGCRHVDFIATDFGKTVFITPEAALKGAEHE